MNLEQKKKLALDQDINVLMERMGYQPVNRTSHDTWYLSPFRPDEEKPSFHVSSGNFIKSIWKDFGRGGDRPGGNIIHLVRELRGFGYKEAIDFVLDHTVGNSYQSSPPTPKPEKKFKPSEKADRHILLEAKAIQHPSILRYLMEERCLTKPVIQNYLKEVYFEDTQKEKVFFAPGIANLKGGYEINNQVNGIKFKSVVPSSSKSMSFIQGTEQRNRLLVFEGFLDALSYLVYYQQERFADSVLILNSASLEKEAISFIQDKDFDMIEGYFDHDARGKELNGSFSAVLGQFFQDRSHLYVGHSDFNALLQSRKKG